MTLCGVGIDVADVGRLARVLQRSGGRFTARWFTAEERRECEGAAQPVTAYATRFAAKEAVWKALDRAALARRFVTVRGPVTRYRDRPQIEITKVEQVSTR